MATKTQKALLILLAFDLIIAALIVTAPSGLQALLGWLVLNFLIIVPVFLIKTIISRKKRSQTRRSSNSKYFDGAIYDPSTEQWKAPAKGSIYAENISSARDSNPNNSQYSNNFPLNMRSQDTLSNQETNLPTISRSHSYHEPDFVDTVDVNDDSAQHKILSIKPLSRKIPQLNEILSEGFFLLSMKGEFKLLKRDSKATYDNNDKNINSIDSSQSFALIKDNQQMWRINFSRVLTSSLSTGGFTTIVWEKVESTPDSYFEASIPRVFLTILGKDGTRIFEIELPYPSYAAAASEQAVVFATAFPDNSIYFYEIANGTLKWKVSGSNDNSVARIELNDKGIMVYDSDKGTLQFVLNADGNVIDDPSGTFTIDKLIEQLRNTLQNMADVKQGWNESRTFSKPLVSVMKLDGLPNQIDINVWSHTSEHKSKVTAVVSTVLDTMSYKIIVEGLEDISNEEKGILDPSTWQVIEGSKPVFRKLIRARIR